MGWEHSGWCQCGLVFQGKSQIQNKIVHMFPQGICLCAFVVPLNNLFDGLIVCTKQKVQMQKWGEWWQISITNFMRSCSPSAGVVHKCDLREDGHTRRERMRLWAEQGEHFVCCVHVGDNHEANDWFGQQSLVNGRVGWHQCKHMVLQGGCDWNGNNLMKNV